MLTMSSVDSSDKQMLNCTQFKNLVLDVGGVLLHPNLDVSYGTAVPPKQFKRMLRSNVWYEYQMGNMSPDEAFRQLSLRSDCSAEELLKFYRNARAALVPVMEIVKLVERLPLKLYCMTNSPAEDAEAVQKAYPEIFGRFEKIFTSSGIGMLKPSLKFFKHVLDESGILPSETVLLDDSLANTIAAESLGITCILVPSMHNAHAMGEAVKEIVSTLRTTEEQLSAAREYMVSFRGVDRSLVLTHEGVRLPVYFDHFVIADLLEDELFLPIGAAPATGTINFFHPSERFVRNGYTSSQPLPDDADTTSIGLAALKKFSKVLMPQINTVLDKMEKDLINEDGLFTVYFDPQRPRVDPVCIINTLYLFHLAGRGGEVTQASEEFIFNLLQCRGYKRGSTYYSTPESFLFQLARLVFDFRDHFARAGFIEVLRSRVLERMGSEGDALTLALRILACLKCGMPNSCSRDLEKLICRQNVNGSWDVCPFYRNNDPNTWMGSEAVTTAFAICAIEGYKNATSACLKAVEG